MLKDVAHTIAQVGSELAGPMRGAMAYLDPGSGSYLLQLLIAGALGGLFAVRAYWSRIKGFFSGLFSRGIDDEEGD